MAIYHCTVKIVKRSQGRSAVAAAAYRSGTKLVNEWDGMSHDYTRKGGIVHAEILLPSRAPPEFSDRSTLWNSVELNEKSRDAQLAREIEIALPVELNWQEQLNLVRAYVKENFVSAGMCADFALHDKGDGNPHAHILLTMRPLTEEGKWGAKCRKVYDLDEHGERIPDGKGGLKNHREDTTDWNDKGNVERWRSAWAAACNRALEQAGRPERVDHRSYKRQGVKQLPSVHMGVAASQMEWRGIQTDKGSLNREITEHNKLLKEVKARLARLHNWSKKQAQKPQGKESVMAQLVQARLETGKGKSQSAKIKILKKTALLYNFLCDNGIHSVQELHDKISVMNKNYYDLRGKIVSAERRITELTERLEMYAQYEQNRSVHKRLSKAKPGKRDQYKQEHHTELALYESAVRYLDKLKANGETISVKNWRSEITELTAQKDLLYQEMRGMRDEIKTVEDLRKTAEQLARQEQKNEPER